MRVYCIRVPSPLPHIEIDVSPWVSLHREYLVASVLATPGSRVQLQLVTDDGASLGWFDADHFMTVDNNIPATWAARVTENGVLELAPEAWLRDGFWEAFYDGDELARHQVDSELEILKKGQ